MPAMTVCLFFLQHEFSSKPCGHALELELARARYTVRGKLVDARQNMPLAQ